DDAYLLAWKARHGAEPVSQEDGLAALKALMSRYVETGHWESVLRVIDRMAETAAGDQPSELLLLRITATEQRAYQFAPEDPPRATLMGLLRGLVAESATYDEWTNDELAWRAEEAQVAGANDETIHYFRLLAVRDPGNAAQWHSKLGDS